MIFDTSGEGKGITKIFALAVPMSDYDIAVTSGEGKGITKIFALAVPMSDYDIAVTSGEGKGITKIFALAVPMSDYDIAVTSGEGKGITKIFALAVLCLITILLSPPVRARAEGGCTPWPPLQPASPLPPFRCGLSFRGYLLCK